MALSRHDVVRAGVCLLDEVGLDGLTLRRLAARLDVSAPTLYWHVRDKREMLDLMAEAILAEHRPSTRPAHGQPWWEWLAEAASAQYRALVSHRDAALVVAGNRPTKASLPVVEQVIGALVEVGFPPTEALESILTIGHFVVGSAVEYQAGAARSDAPGPRVQADEGLPPLAFARRWCGPEPDATFRHGLSLIIAGLRIRHRELTDDEVTLPTK